MIEMIAFLWAKNRSIKSSRWSFWYVLVNAVVICGTWGTLITPFTTAAVVICTCIPFLVFAQHNTLKSFPILSKHHVFLPIDSLLAPSMHQILPPCSFILPLIPIQDAKAVSLSINMLTYVPSLPFKRYANPSHLIVLKHAVISKVIIECQRAYAMLLIIVIHLTIVNCGTLGHFYEILLDIRVWVYVQFRIVLLSQVGSGVVLFSKLVS